jgi:hypothetical protein
VQYQHFSGHRESKGSEMIFTGKTISFMRWLICAGMCISSLSCGIFENAGSGSEAGNSSRIALLSDSLLVNIPSSATGDSSVVLAKRATVQDDIMKTYIWVRGYVKFANELVQDEHFGIKKLIASFRDSLPWDKVVKEGTVTGDFDGLSWKASFIQKDEYPYQLSVAVPARPSGPAETFFTLVFNGSESSPGGRVFYRFDLLDSSKIKNPLKVAVSFNASAGVKHMDVRIESDSILIDTSGFKKVVLQLVEKDGVLHLSGGAYHPRLLNLIPDTVEYCYEFYGVADMVNNRSILYVGLPPATIDNDDITLFSKYSISSIITRKFVRQDLRMLNDTLKRCVVTSYKDSLSLLQIFDSVLVKGIGWLRPVKEFETITVEDFIYFVELNKNVDDANFRSFRLLLELAKQPVYFDRSGYVGNGDRVPDSFISLATIKCLLAIQKPQAVRGLSVNPDW